MVSQASLEVKHTSAYSRSQSSLQPDTPSAFDRTLEDLKLLLDGQLPDDYQNVEQYEVYASLMEQLILVHVAADRRQEAKAVRLAWETIKHEYETLRQAIEGFCPLIQHAHEITEKSMRWLWYPYIPRDMIVMLDGDPGLGKGLMLIQVATNLSLGLPFLDQFGKSTLTADVTGPQTTLILTAEDSLEYVMVPRLKRAGADLTHIKFLTGWLSPDGREHAFDLQHMPILIEAIKETTPVLVILDPLAAYLGDIDMHRSNQTRPVMSALRAVGETYECTMMGVRHPSKMDQGGPLMYRGQGNMDIIGAARSGLWVQKHPAHPETKTLMIHDKTNISMHGRTVVFSRERGEFEWVGVSRLTESMLTGKGPDPHAFLEAFFWLEERMTPGHPYESTRIEKEARERDISDATLKRARKMLGIQARKIGDNWYSILPHFNNTQTTNTTNTTNTTKTTCDPSTISTTYGKGIELREDGEVVQEDQVGGVVIRAREDDEATRRAHINKLWARG
jgi:AAA domain